jgi:hypothetical protein
VPPPIILYCISLSRIRGVEFQSLHIIITRSCLCCYALDKKENPLERQHISSSIAGSQDSVIFSKITGIDLSLDQIREFAKFIHLIWGSAIDHLRGLTQKQLNLSLGPKTQNSQLKYQSSTARPFLKSFSLIVGLGPKLPLLLS